MWRKRNRDERDDLVADLVADGGTTERLPVPIDDTRDRDDIQDRVQDSSGDGTGTGEQDGTGTGNVVPLRSVPVPDRDSTTGTDDPDTDTGTGTGGVRVEQVPWDGTGEVV